jgi:hypothetical protein
MRRLPLLAVALGLVAAACAYESVGTTTTTTAAADMDAPSTGPAEIVLSDQRAEGTALVVESVTLPDSGWVVLQADDGGGPGEIIGVSDLLNGGTTLGASVAFFLPLEDDSIVHATLHVDMDRDGRFTYEPPDDFVDVPATREDGTAATDTVFVELLPPLTPGAVAVDEQRTDGTTVLVGGVTLPAPGFVAVQRNEGGEPGTVLGLSGALAAGDGADLLIELDTPLAATGLVFVVAYVDRNEDGELSGVGDPEGDAIAVSAGGEPAVASAVITVVPLSPVSVTFDNQEGDGTTVTVGSLTLPSPGWMVLLVDEGGAPGTRIGLSPRFPAGTSTDYQFVLDEPLTEDVVLWIQVRIDFDEDGRLTDADPQGLTESGSPLRVPAEYTYVEPDDEEEDTGDGG